MLGAARVAAVWVEVQPMMLLQTLIVMPISASNEWRIMPVRLAIHAQDLPGQNLPDVRRVPHIRDAVTEPPAQKSSKYCRSVHCQAASRRAGPTRIGLLLIVVV